MQQHDISSAGLSTKWLVFSVIVTLAVAFSLPLEQMAFHENLTHPALFFLRWFGYVVFSIDLFLRYRNGEYARKSAGRSWLLTDVLSALPLAPILFRLWSSAPMWLMITVHLLPVLRMARVYVLTRYWQQVNPSQTGLRRIATTLVIIALMIHWIGCWQLAIYDQDSGSGFVLRYTQAVYWTITTMTTVGYGDVTPDKHDTSQLLFTMLIMVIGAGTFGYIIGNIATIMSNLDFARNQHLDKMQRINAFLRHNHVPPNLRRSVHDYHTYLWRTRQGFNEAEILTDLPPSLRIEVELHLRRDVVSKVPFFRGADMLMIRALVAQLEPRIALPGELIIRKGDIGERMYFIASGNVEVLGPDGNTPVASLGDGSFFGEIALIERCPRVADVRATTYCDLYTLDKSSLDVVTEKYPDFGKHIQEMAAQRKSP